MKIVSWNVNGIRAARKKSFNQFIEKTNPDIICIQEGKAQMRVLKEIDYTLSGYKMYWTEAKKAGYSGVAIWVKDEISVLSVKLNIGTTHFDDEGRTVIIELNDCFLINSYYPNGRDDLSRVDFKLEYSYEILKIAKELEKTKPVILTGDFNTAHYPYDLARPDANMQSTGFLPIERKFLDQLVNDNFVDAFRIKYPEARDVYSYWSYRGGAKPRNVGWRIDYFWVSKILSDKIKEILYFKEENSSDHCPLILNIEI